MNKDVLRRMVQTVLTLLTKGFILFITAWTLKWIWAWVFISLGAVMLIINVMVLPREVIEERGKRKENVKNAGILLIIRTLLEDRTLIAELDGYVEYTQKVKYRLIPFIR